MKNRFLVEAALVERNVVTITGEEFHHARVLRLKEGEEVELFDGRGTIAKGNVTIIAPDALHVSVATIIPSRELPSRIIVAPVLIHPDKFELVLQKATELGAAEFIPLTSDRMETRVERVAGKVARWEKIIREATKQCGRGLIPAIAAPMPFARLAERPEKKVLFEAGAPQETRPGITDTILLVGPEGGWSDGELALAREREFEFRSLGPRRLRAETAAIVATAMMAASLEGWSA